MAQAAAMPKSDIGGDDDRNGEQREPDRGQGVGLADGRKEVRPALCERLREHDHDRKDEEEGEERERHGREQPSGPRRGPSSRAAGGRGPRGPRAWLRLRRPR